MVKKIMNVRDINPEDFFRQITTEEKIKFLLRYAVLAPSTHNSQPWLFKIENNSCKIFFDREKYNIREADPFNRDLYVSFGCLIENLFNVASYFRVFRDMNFYFNDNLIAEMFFVGLENNDANGVDKEYEPLLRAMVDRVNARGIFENRPIPTDLLDKIKSFSSEHVKINLITEKEKIKKLASLTEEGLKMAYRSKEFRLEMSGWVHHSLSSKREGIPGYSLRMPLPISFIFPYLLRWFNIGSKVGLLNRLSIASAPMVAVFTSPESNRRVWFEVGRAAERLMLWARVWELKTSIFVAAIEIGDLYKKVQEVIGTKEIPHLLMCAGYLDFNQKPNQRHPVEAKLMNK